MKNQLILTQRGIIDIDNLIPLSDKVYEYGSSKLLTVLGTEETESDKLILVEYTDGRFQIVTCDDYVYTGHGVVKACDLVNNHKECIIPLYKTEFQSGIRRPLNPDPYVSGALFIYGDYGEEFMNLPLDRSEVNNTLSHKYNLEYYPLIGNNKVYFQWKGKDTDHRITWGEFFPCYDFYAKSGKIESPAVPDDYMYSSYEDRVQFIRGVFDTGYNKPGSPDYVSINHWSKERLSWVQRMLWSMGIPTRYFEDSTQIERKHWRLDILGSLEDYPGFYYWILYINNMIQTDQRVLKLSPKVRYGITSVSILSNDRIRAKHLVLQKPSLYMTPQYLPRVSH